VFYDGGYEVQTLINATGYAHELKLELFKRQINHFLGEESLKKLDVFEIQS